jgi:O-6-methylguanine DNA methyltransferase
MTISDSNTSNSDDLSHSGDMSHSHNDANALFYTIYENALGKLILVASARGLKMVRLLGEGQTAQAWLTDYATKTGAHPIEMPGFFAKTIQKLDDYFDNATPLTLPYEITTGTALQRAVWLKIAEIPYGRTISYSDLANQVGFARAVRAVASACGANPVPLIIPCHRVVAKDGSLGGFSLGGLAVKEELLALEKSPHLRKVA